MRRNTLVQIPPAVISGALHYLNVFITKVQYQYVPFQKDEYLPSFKRALELFGTFIFHV